MASWHDPASATYQWFDAPVEQDQLVELLTVARAQCEEYAPAVTDPEDVPDAYRYAQLLQARNLWNSSKKDENDSIGGDGFAIRTFPMDWTVKNLLRPKRGIPLVG